MTANILSSRVYAMEYVNDFVPGRYNPRIEIGVTGKVINMDVKGPKFAILTISDVQNADHMVRVVCSEQYYQAEDGETISQILEDVQEGDSIIVRGCPGKTKNGNPVIRCYSLDTLDDEEEEEDSIEDEEEEGADVAEDTDDTENDPDYEPTTVDSYESSEASDAETEYSTEDEEEEEQSVPQRSITFESIPMTVFTNSIVYMRRVFPIVEVDTTTPMQVGLTTSFGTVIITNMTPGKYLGVYVPQNRYEPDFPYGYDVIVPGSFDKLVYTLI